MNLVELDQALRLRLSGMADVLDTRLQQAQTEQMAPIDLVAGSSTTNSSGARSGCSPGGTSRPDSVTPGALDGRLRLQREDRPRARLRAHDRALRRPARGRPVFGPARYGQEPPCRRPSDAPPSSRASRHLPRGAHLPRGTRRGHARRHAKAYLAELTRVPLLLDDLGMRKLPHTAAEDLLELIMRRYERASTLLTSNRPVDDWGKLLGDTAAVTALLGPAPSRARAQVRAAQLAHQGPNIRGWVEGDRWAPPRVATRRAACQRAARVLRVRFGPAG